MPNVLKNKSFKTYAKLSRYATFPYFYHSIDDKYIYGITSQLNNTTAYANHIVVYGDTLDSIALDAYNDPCKYWIIADYNRIQDPTKKLTVGSVIKVPVLSAIEFIE